MFCVDVLVYFSPLLYFKFGFIWLVYLCLYIFGSSFLEIQCLFALWIGLLTFCFISLFWGFLSFSFLVFCLMSFVSFVCLWCYSARVSYMCDLRFFGACEGSSARLSATHSLPQFHWSFTCILISRKGLFGFWFEVSLGMAEMMEILWVPAFWSFGFVCQVLEAIMFLVGLDGLSKAFSFPNWGS
jgi:hypothetical protein